MASRKEQKEEARQARLAAEQAAAARSAQTRRLGTIGGVVVIAVIVVVVAIVVSSSSSSAKKGGIPTGKDAGATYATVQKELQGIPQTGTVLGNSKAPVTIQYFGDLECPICADFTLGVDHGGLPQLIAGPVRDGQIKLDYKSLETASGAVNSSRFIPQQTAAYAAGAQHLFWEYAEIFYHEQESEDTHYVTEDFLRGLANQIPNLNTATWLRDRTDSSYPAQIAADEQVAQKDGIDGTPSLVVIGSKGETLISQSIPTYAQITTAVKTVS